MKLEKNIFTWAYCTALLLPAAQAAEEPFFRETDAAHSDRLLRIPEPMVYDLVRPLGVRQGDMEVNALVDINPHTDDVSWAPEVEYGLADDLALELELPFEDASHERYKVAIQKTLGIYNHLGMANGWQAFLDLNKHTKTLSGDATYIHAVRWADQWSSLSMLGLRINGINRSAEVEYLLNNTVFYDVSPRLTLGLELNQEVSSGGSWRYRLTPQLHYDINQHYTLQAGVAASTLNAGSKTEKLWSFRLIRVF
ncbi:hypothetical protein [Methylophilus luteus]|uniref:Transporter n=1 Tax=Methylophilus luteus TaxID=640108 RepID=A0ABW3F6C1_9PROT